MLSALDDQDQYVISAVSSALQRIRDTAVVDGLLALLSHDRFWLRERAAQVLGTIGDARAIEPLVYAMGDQNQNVPSAAAGALTRIKNWPTTQEAVRAAIGLEEKLRDQDKYVREAVFNALKQLLVYFRSGRNQAAIDRMDRTITKYRHERKERCANCDKKISIVDRIAASVTKRVCVCGWSALYCEICNEPTVQSESGLDGSFWKCLECGSKTRI